MADSVTTKITGVEETKAAMGNFSANMDATVKQAVLNLAGHVLYLAKKNCKEKFTGTPSFDPAAGTPTGRLMGSLTMASNWGKKTGVSGKAKSEDAVGPPTATDAHAANVGTNVEYAMYPEFGTRKMTPRPYLYPAFYKCENDLPSEIKKEAEKRGTLDEFKRKNESFDPEVKA